MVTDRRLDVRVALAWAVLTGIATLLTMPLLQPEQVGFATDAYYHAVRAFLSGENPYLAGSTPSGTPPYIYPPAALLAFLPHALTGSETVAFALQTAVNLLTIAAFAVLLLRIMEDDGVDLGRPDRVLLVAFVALSPHATTVLIMGQVNLQLGLAVAVGALLVERGHGRAAGVAFALAAAVKLFPAAAGAWLLRLREWRAVATAIATGLATLVVGALVVDRVTFETYLLDVLPSESHTEQFAGGLPPDAMYVTVRRPIAALLPNVDPDLYAPLALLVVLPIVLACYRTVESRDGKRIALLATMLAAIILLPFEAFYFSLLYFPLVPLLFTLEPGRPRQLLAAGTILLSTVVTLRSVERFLEAVALPDGLEATTRSFAGVLTVVQPPLIGAFLVLGACVLWQHRAATAPAS